MEIRLILVFLIAAAVQDADPSKDIDEARRRLGEALDGGDPAAVARRAAADRKHVFALANELITGYLERLSQEKHADRKLIEAVVAAFSKLPNRTTLEQRQAAALQARLEMAGRFTPRDAKAYFETGDLIRRSREEAAAGKFKEAADHLDQILAYMERIGDATGRLVAILDRALLEEQQGRLEPALKHFESALKISQEIGDQEGELGGWFHIGPLLRELGRCRQAADALEAGIALSRQLGDPGLLATFLVHLGDARTDLLQLDAALRHYEEAIKIFRASKSREEEGRVLRRMAIADARMGQEESARERLEQALAIARELDDRAQEAGVLRNLGALSMRQGRYKEALLNHEQALKIHQATSDAAGEGATLADIGQVCLFLGRYNDAIKRESEALKIALDLKDFRLQAEALGHIGLIYSDVEQHTTALLYFSLALERVEQSGDRTRKGVALAQLGLVFCHLGYYDDALFQYESALKIHRELGHVDEEAAALADIGSILGYMGRFDEAFERCRQALAIAERGSDRRRQAVMLWNVGTMKLHQGQAAEALPYLERAIKMAESVRSSLGMLQAEKAGWFAFFRPLYELAAYATAETRKPEESLRFFEMMRSRNLLDAVAARREVPATLLARKNELISRYNVSRGRLEGAVRALAESVAVPDRDKLQAEADRSRREIADLEADLARATHEIELQQNVEETQPLSAPDIQSRLADGEALVMFNIMGKYDVASRSAKLPSQEKILVGLMTRSAMEVVQVDKPGDLAAQVRWLREAAVNSGRGFPADRFRSRARRLYDLLLKPLEPKLKGIRRLILSPDELLYSLPFEALVVSDAGKEYAEFDYLGKRHEIEYVYSGTLLARRRSESFKAEGEFVGYGDPDYGTVTGSTTRSGAPPLRGASNDVPEEFRPFLDAKSEGERRGWSKLAFSGAEVTEIAGLFRANPRLGREACEQNVKKLSGARILHFACHGLVDGAEPMKSALVLTADKENDGYLEAREIADLKMPCELVVLSACDSASGEMLRGEGLIGLTRAFMIAGARSVVASLWTVSDEGGKEFMVSFYKKLAAGQDKSAALAGTKREFMKREKYSAPYYWAGFVLHGE